MSENEENQLSYNEARKRLEKIYFEVALVFVSLITLLFLLWLLLLKIFNA